ncbi:MAG: phosphoribosylanthranilate isomerase, partial [Bacteroidota bacterium]
GIRWDWTKLKEYTGPVPFLLSGGIGPADATDVRGVRHPQLAGVDLNSKFETEPGGKDTRLLEIFLRDLREN